MSQKELTLTNRFILSVTLITALVGVPIADAQTPAPKPAAPVARDLEEYRKANPTHLTRHGPPPKAWQDPTPLKAPAGVKQVPYESGGLKLKAWLSDAPNEGKTNPAVDLCHGEVWIVNDVL